MLNVELNTQRTLLLPARLFGESSELQSLLQSPVDLHNFNPYLQWRRYKAWKDTNRWLRDQINSLLANAEQNVKAADIIDLAIQEFGPDGRDIKGIYTQILENPIKLLELKYTMQCIKEIPRLYPPGATARICQDDRHESHSKYF